MPQKERNSRKTVSSGGCSITTQTLQVDNTASFGNFQEECADLMYNMHIFDSEKSELDQKFKPKKQKSILLAESYKRIRNKKVSVLDNEDLTEDDYERIESSIIRIGRKSERVNECGSFLQFGREINSDLQISEKQKLHDARFCKDRLCPQCSWRRELKMYAQVLEIVQYMESHDYNYEYIFLTLTAPNVKGPDLKDTLSRFMHAFDKLMKRREVKRIVQGFIRVLEITRNDNRYSKSYDTYHPHYHVLIAVNKSYFKNGYIKRDKWLQYWRECYQDETITQVDVRRVRSKDTIPDYESSLGNAILEIAKYTVKSKDYLIENNNQKTDEIVETLSDAIYRRKLVKMGGVFADVQKILNQTDLEDNQVDLIHIDENKPAAEVIGWLMSIFRYLQSAADYELQNYFFQDTDGNQVEWEELEYIAKHRSSEGEPSKHPPDENQV